MQRCCEMFDRRVVQISSVSEYHLPFPWTWNADGCTVAVDDTRWHCAIPSCKVNARKWYLVLASVFEIQSCSLAVAALPYLNSLDFQLALSHQCISHFFRLTACFNRSPTLTNSFWFISRTVNRFAAFAGSLYKTTDQA